MKNKSKLSKFKKEKTTAKKVPAEWLYLLPEEVSMRALYDSLFDSKWKAEYWEAAGVLEVEIPEAASVDMEEMECSLGDEIGDAYLAEHGVKTVYAVTIKPDDFAKAKEVMEYLTEKNGGFFCGDTDDFEPQVKK